MYVTRTLKLKKITGNLDDVDDFEKLFLKIFDTLDEFYMNNYISYKQHNSFYTVFSINLHSKIFWYDHDFMYWDILNANRYDNTEERISNFLKKYLDLNDFKRQEFRLQYYDDFV